MVLSVTANTGELSQWTAPGFVIAEAEGQLGLHFYCQNSIF